MTQQQPDGPPAASSRGLAQRRAACVRDSAHAGVHVCAGRDQQLEDFAGIAAFAVVNDAVDRRVGGGGLDVGVGAGGEEDPHAFRVGKRDGHVEGRLVVLQRGGPKGREGGPTAVGSETPGIARRFAHNSLVHVVGSAPGIQGGLERSGVVVPDSLENVRLHRAGARE